MEIARVVLSWAGPMVVGSAVTVLHYAADSSDPDPAAIKTAVDNLVSALPSGLTVTTPNTGDVIEDTTGTLVRPWTGTGGGATAGVGTANSAAGVGACVTWSTGGIVNGRRLRGRTFLVPLSNAAYDGVGTLAAGSLAAIEGFADDLMASGPLGVWHRPTSPGGSDGVTYGVVSRSVRDKVAILTSRRD